MTGRRKVLRLNCFGCCLGLFDVCTHSCCFHPSIFVLKYAATQASSRYNKVERHRVTSNIKLDHFQNEAGNTPLHDAILAEHHNMVDMLLDCPRICITLCNGEGFNYLQLAVWKGNKR